MLCAGAWGSRLGQRPHLASHKSKQRASSSETGMEPPAWLCTLNSNEKINKHVQSIRIHARYTRAHTLAVHPGYFSSIPAFASHAPQRTEYIHMLALPTTMLQRQHPTPFEEVHQKGERGARHTRTHPLVLTLFRVPSMPSASLCRAPNSKEPCIRCSDYIFQNTHV